MCEQHCNQCICLAFVAEAGRGQWNRPDGSAAVVIEAGRGQWNRPDGSAAFVIDMANAQKVYAASIETAGVEAKKVSSKGADCDKRPQEWRVRIPKSVVGKEPHIGYYADEADAANALDR